MKRDDWMLLTLTCLTGLAIGMYVYIAAFKPLYMPENLSNTEAEASNWSLVGKQRNIDQDASYIQPSFRILGDRQYVYLPGGQANDALVPREGKISSALMRDLRGYDNELEAYSEPVPNQNCDTATEYEYRFTVDGDTYILDSCRTRLQNDTAFLDLLGGTWEEIAGTNQNRLNKSFFDWAQNWLNERIGVQK